MSGARSLQAVTAADLRAWLATGDTLLVDIREPEEHACGAIPGARPEPLSRYPERLASDGAARRVVFHCKTGRRTEAAAARLARSTALPAFALAGGLDGWDEEARRRSL